jgi:hypothetical protein
VPAQVVLHGIADLQRPVPVDSSFEREAANFFVDLVADRLRSGDRHAAVRKPLFAGPSGRLVDFEFPGWRRYVEVFGMDLPAYREKEALRRTALENSPIYDGWKGIHWKANGGESLEAFKDKFLRQLP